MKYVFHFDFVYSARWLLGWSIDGIDSFALQELLRLGKRYMWIMRFRCGMETEHFSSTAASGNESSAGGHHAPAARAAHFCDTARCLPDVDVFLAMVIDP